MRADDVEQVEAIAENRRQRYATFQPQFRRVAPGAVEKHAAFLRVLALDDSVVSLVSTHHATVTGYVIGRLVPPPPVYDPGGPSGYIDDFALADGADWEVLGVALLREVTKLLAAMGAAQAVVVCGAHDTQKKRALESAGLGVASEWYVATLRDPQQPDGK